MRKDEIPVGVRRERGKWKACVVVKGRYYAKRFPRDTPLAVMREWRESRRVKVRQDALVALATQPEPSDEPTFKDDADTYLAAVRSMPSFSDQSRLIAAWSNVFEGRRRQDVTSLEIRTQLEQWLAAGYAPSTVNKRRTALQAMFTKLNGKGGVNPVRDVAKYAEPAEPRAQSLWTLYRILALMRPSKTRARLRVMIWTGWPHKQLKQLKPEHLQLKKGLAYVTPRRKGKGQASGRWLPLLPGAIVALREFDRLDCYTPTVKGKPKPFSNSAMHSAFMRAVKKFNARRAHRKQRLIDVRPYDARHSFATWLAGRITDERALQEVLLHSTAAQSRRYSEAATAARVKAAIQQAGAAI